MASLRDLLLFDFEWQILTPEFVVLLFALLAPLVALWNTDRKGMQQFAAIGLGGAFLLTLGSLLGWNVGIPGTGIEFTLEYIATESGDPLDLKGVYDVTVFSQLLKLIFLGVSFLTVISVGRPFRGPAEEDFGEFYSLLMFATLGMMVVASAHELITLLIGIEIASMSSYLLAAFKRDRRAAEASMKYFVIGAISSGMSLFAISLLYAATGTTELRAIGQAIGADGLSALAGVASVLLIAGLGFKISSVPFHAWAPDVYHGATTPVAGMLAAGSKAMGFAAVFSVFLVGLGAIKGSWELAVALVAVASMTFGNLVAIQQKSVARMLAYSSIAQAGYLLIAVAVGTWYAVGGGLLHLMVNAAMKVGAFVVVGVLLSVGAGDTVNSYKGLGRKAPFLAIAMTVFLLSMAGIPPLGGFTSKFVLFSGAIDAGITQHLGWLIWLAVFAVVNSAISLFYYLRLIRNMFVEGEDDGIRFSVPLGARVALFACMALILAVGIWPQPFVDVAMEAARSLLVPA